MAIEFIRVIRRIIPGENPGMKYMLVIKRPKKVGINQIFNGITEHSSLSRGDVKNAIDNFMHEVTKHLQEGSIVDLGEYGSFTPHIQSKTVDSLEKANASIIKKINVSFRMGKEMKEALKNTPKILGSLEVKGYQKRH
ncbi:MAG: HU family DNA-binding protein [Bacteroidales bacterium]|jgi:predicted histone-like DNA-binding protein|nr:HU family DNA-binding protein [Bacteroidales bacterium]